MSSIGANAFRAAIEADVRAAWPEVVSIIQGQMRRAPEALPIAQIALSSVPMEPSAMITVEQTYRFVIGYRAKWPGGDRIEDEKERVANALIERLMADPEYAGGYLPMIEAVEFEEEGEPDEGTFEVGIAFSVRKSERTLTV